MYNHCMIAVFCSSIVIHSNKEIIQKLNVKNDNWKDAKEIVFIDCDFNTKSLTTEQNQVLNNFIGWLRNSKKYFSFKFQDCKNISNEFLNDIEEYAEKIENLNTKISISQSLTPNIFSSVSINPFSANLEGESHANDPSELEKAKLKLQIYEQSNPSLAASAKTMIEKGDARYLMHLPTFILPQFPNVTSSMLPVLSIEEKKNLNQTFNKILKQNLLSVMNHFIIGHNSTKEYIIGLLISSIINRGSNTNILLIGEPGIGKTKFTYAYGAGLAYLWLLSLNNWQLSSNNIMQAAIEIAHCFVLIYDLSAEKDPTGLFGIRRSYRDSGPGWWMKSVFETGDLLVRIAPEISKKYNVKIKPFERPSIVIDMDEIEKFRASINSGGGEDSKQRLELFLQSLKSKWVDYFTGFEASSKGFFLMATANSKPQNNAPLLDRFHLIQLAPLYDADKIRIGFQMLEEHFKSKCLASIDYEYDKQHLIEKMIVKIEDRNIVLESSAIKALIDKKIGVRALEDKISSLFSTIILERYSGLINNKNVFEFVTGIQTLDLIEEIKAQIGVLNLIVRTPDGLFYTELKCNLINPIHQTGSVFGFTGAGFEKQDWSRNYHGELTDMILALIESVPSIFKKVESMFYSKKPIFYLLSLLDPYEIRHISVFYALCVISSVLKMEIDPEVIYLGTTDICGNADFYDAWESRLKMFTNNMQSKKKIIIVAPSSMKENLLLSNMINDLKLSGIDVQTFFVSRFSEVLKVYIPTIELYSEDVSAEFKNSYTNLIKQAKIKAE